MKRKCFLLGLFLILIMFLVGCSGIGLPDTEAPITDEEKIEHVINDFFLALNEEDWEKAKSLCVDHSIWYDFVSNFERAVYGNIDDTYILEFSYSISSFYFITGCTCPLLAIVFGEFFMSLTINGELQGFEEWGIITLQKINNDWQLFSDELPAGLVI